MKKEPRVRQTAFVESFVIKPGITICKFIPQSLFKGEKITIKKTKSNMKVIALFVGQKQQFTDGRGINVDDFADGKEVQMDACSPGLEINLWIESRAYKNKKVTISLFGKMVP